VRISVLNNEKLQAVILALRGFDRTLQGQVRRHTKAIGQPQWQSAVNANTSTRLESSVLGRTARMQVSNQNVTLKSGSSTRALSKGGASPRDIARAVEFGSELHEQKITARSSKGRAYSYTRTGGRQFRHTNRKGYAVYPAAARMIPRFAALWAQTTVRTFMEAMEGKRG
jgi:hypothetical protein